jgi:hypothetical protein
MLTKSLPVFRPKGNAVRRFAKPVYKFIIIKVLFGYVKVPIPQVSEYYFCWVRITQSNLELFVIEESFGGWRNLETLVCFLSLG